MNFLILGAQATSPLSLPFSTVIVLCQYCASGKTNYDSGHKYRKPKHTLLSNCVLDETRIGSVAQVTEIRVSLKFCVLNLHAYNVRLENPLHTRHTYTHVYMCVVKIIIPKSDFRNTNDNSYFVTKYYQLPCTAMCIV